MKMAMIDQSTKDRNLVKSFVEKAGLKLPVILVDWEGASEVYSVIASAIRHYSGIVEIESSEKAGIKFNSLMYEFEAPLYELRGKLDKIIGDLELYKEELKK
jgi:hypothetical protein